MFRAFTLCFRLGILPSNLLADNSELERRWRNSISLNARQNQCAAGEYVGSWQDDGTMMLRIDPPVVQ